MTHGKRTTLVLAVAALGGLTLYFALPARQGDVASPPVLVAWTFELPARGAVLARPVCVGRKLYFAAVRDAGLMTHGAVHCLDLDTRRLAWSFDDDGGMLQTFSSPAVADGRLFVGEGMHAARVCHLYSLELATGHKLWTAPAGNHIERGPTVVGDRVFFGAGDDGVYCVAAATGAEVWRYPGLAHVDTTPAVVGNRVFVGSGVSRAVPRPAAVALDADTGKVVWHVPTDLPVWGSPQPAGDVVLFGLGNGRLTEPPQVPETPAGAVLALDAATGAEHWRFNGDAVFGQPTIDSTRVYAGMRDGRVVALERASGKLAWATPIGSAVAASPTLDASRLLVASTKGRVVALDVADGRIVWSLDLAARADCPVSVMAAPLVIADGIIVAAEAKVPGGSAATVYCLPP